MCRDDEKRLLVEAWVEELEPMIRCPRYKGCSAPICPLDPHKDMGVPAGLGETHCTLPKAKRLELGALLPWRGLWPRELAGVRVWEGKSLSEQAAQAEQGLRNLGLL